MKRLRLILTLMIVLLGAGAYADETAAEEGVRKQALSQYAGEYVGQWKLLDFRDVPYVELGEYLRERDFGKRDTLRVEVQDDSTLAICLQRGRVHLRVVHYKAYVRGASREEELYFKVLPSRAEAPFRYRSADARFELSFSVVGGEGGYSYLGVAGYSEGDGSLLMPKGELDVESVVAHTGFFDGQAIRMQGRLRFMLQRKAAGEIKRVSERMDARCRGCF